MTRRFPRRPLFALLALTGAALFLFYGPFESFRLLWINTAIYSSRFKFLATALYSEKYLQSVLDMNKPAPGLATDARGVTVAGGDGLSIVPVRGKYYQGFLITIEDPARLFLVPSGAVRGRLLEDLAAEHGALGGVNASGYADHRARGAVWGITIMDGVTVSRLTRGERHVMGGFTAEGKLTAGYFTEEEIAAQGYVWAVEFGPLYIVNGIPAELTAYSGGLAPRTAIGQTADGAVLLVVTDGRRAGSFGATYHDIQTLLHSSGAVNAIGLDGGSSSTMVWKGEVVNIPSDGDAGRLLPNAILFR
jgi:exopolysaccharide biosynthesis protein